MKNRCFLVVVLAAAVTAYPVSASAIVEKPLAQPATVVRSAILPEKYGWLLDHDMPAHLRHAAGYLGMAGSPENIAKLVSVTKQPGDGVADAWCGVFVGAMVHLAGKRVPKTLRGARFWEGHGTKVTRAHASPGDVVLIERGQTGSNGRHVAFYVQQDERFIYVLGGNQTDERDGVAKVSIKQYPLEKWVSTWKID